MKGYSDESDISDVTIKDFYWNGKKLSENEISFARGNFVKNVIFK